MREVFALQVVAKQSSPIRLKVDFACEHGELVALIGPSGSGKTTTLRVIAGLYRPENGRVLCNGTVWLDTAQSINLPPHQRRVGMVFQSYALFPHMTALGNIKAALGDLPRSERDQRAQQLLSLVKLDGFATRRPAELSGGQQQRVAVARALARNPEVLLLDEPFAAVDRRTRRSLRAELMDLRRNLNIPILLVTHDIDEAVAIADRICVIDEGETIQIASPRDVLAAPVSDRVAVALDVSTGAVEG